MKVSFVGQPFADESCLYDFIQSALADTGIRELAIVVAWAKRSGLRRVGHFVTSFRQRGGKSLIIVGIDEGGATRQGLKFCIDTFDVAYVFHDRVGGTFHPKVYLAKGGRTARLFVGSNNVTAGGVYDNYEAALDGSLDLANEEDAALLGSIERYIQRLLAAKEVCLPLDDAMLAALDAHPAVILRDEDESWSRKGGPEDVDESPQPDDVEGAPSLFGIPRFAKRRDPRPQPRSKTKGAQRKPTPSPKFPKATPIPPTPQLPPGVSAATRVLIAEIPRGDRWKQANFHKVIYEGFFGAKVGSRRTVSFRHVRDDRSLAPAYERPSVQVKSKNFRFELDAAAGKAYPSSGRPIGVFVEVATRKFVYRLVMPGEPGFDDLVQFLDSNWNGSPLHMRQIPSTVAGVAELETVQDVAAVAPHAFGSP